jgi:hypothetical protein
MCADFVARETPALANLTSSPARPMGGGQPEVRSANVSISGVQG